MLVVTEQGIRWPVEAGRNPVTWLDTLTESNAAFDQGCYMARMTFYNFKAEYTGKNTSQCMENYALYTHRDVADATAGHYMTDVTCKDCFHGWL